jgi:hypothetical protein
MNPVAPVNAMTPRMDLIFLAEPRQTRFASPISVAE